MSNIIPTSMETLRETDMKNVEEALRDVSDLLNYQAKFGKHLDDIKQRVNNNTSSDLENSVLNLFHEKIISAISHLRDIVAVKVDIDLDATKVSFESNNNVSPYVQVSRIINYLMDIIRDTTQKLSNVKYEKL